MSQPNDAKKLTPVQAINIVDRAAADFLGTRADHQRVVEAIGVLLNLVTDHEKRNEAAVKEAVTA